MGVPSAGPGPDVEEDVILADLSDIQWDSFVLSSRRVLTDQDVRQPGRSSLAVAVPVPDNDDDLFSGYDFLGGGEGDSRPQPPPASSNGLSDSDVDIVETSDDEVDSGRHAPPPLILSDDSPGPCSDSDAMDTG